LRTALESGVTRVVSAAAANGLGVVGVLVGTPSWAGNGEANQVPANLSLPVTHPDNYWARFVYNMVLHYRDQVRYWQIWNEPNLDQFWNGSPSDYYRLLKVAYQAAKAADPKAQILFGGLSGQAPSYLEQVLRAAEADPEARAAGYFFDIFAWHTYSRAVQHYDGTLSYRETLARHGLSKPIWITESHIPAWNDPSICGTQCSPEQWHATLEEQAAYVLQAYAYSLAADVKHLSIYRASDVGEPSAWGLLKATGAPRPAYHAYATAARYLQDAEKASLRRGDGYDRVDVFAPGRQISLLWSRGPSMAPVRLEVRSQQALLVDKYGKWLPVKPDQDGRYALHLPAATANSGITRGDYVVGGEPYMLVQDR